MAVRGGILVFIYGAITVVSVLVPYAISVCGGHVDALVPYLSDLGDSPIESTVFTQLFVLEAAATMVLVQVKFVHAFYALQNVEASEGFAYANVMALYSGYASALGLLVLSCFQESHAYYVHHFFGVLVYLFGTLFYCTLQSAISRKTALAADEKLVLRLRVSVNVLMPVFFTAAVVGYVVALFRFDRPWEDRKRWAKEDGGWLPHLISASSQWILLGLFLVYFLTFWSEFKNVLLTRNRILVFQERSEESATAM